MANIITCCRIFISVILIFLPIFTSYFYALYIAGGITDMVDGIIARRTNTVSELGSKLDSIADTLFVVVCLIKILPTLEVKLWLWLWIILIGLIKISNIISGYIYEHQLVMLHTIANKVTGFLLFLIYICIDFIDFKFIAILISIVATYAAIEEGYLIRTGGI